MKKTVLYSLLTLALAALLSACMSQAEREFRSMSAVSQMEDVKNILFVTEVAEAKKEQWDDFVTFSGKPKPTAFFYVTDGKTPKCGFYALDFMDFPLFNVLSPLIYLPGLEGWNFEKVSEKENTFRLTRRKENERLDTIVEIAFDPAGRLPLLSDFRTGLIWSAYDPQGHGVGKNQRKRISGSVREFLRLAQSQVQVHRLAV